MAGLGGDVALHSAEVPDNGTQTAFLRIIGGMPQLVIEKRGIRINLQLQQFQQFQLSCRRHKLLLAAAPAPATPATTWFRMLLLFEGVDNILNLGDGGRLLIQDGLIGGGSGERIGGQLHIADDLAIEPGQQRRRAGFNLTQRGKLGDKQLLGAGNSHRPQLLRPIQYSLSHPRFTQGSGLIQQRLLGFQQQLILLFQAGNLILALLIANLLQLLLQQCQRLLQMM